MTWRQAFDRAWAVLGLALMFACALLTAANAAKLLAQAQSGAHVVFGLALPALTLVALWLLRLVWQRNRELEALR